MTLRHEWCGACHQWGGNPPIENGICRTCHRTPEQILKTHGIFKLELKHLDLEQVLWEFTHPTEGVFNNLTIEDLREWELTHKSAL